MGTVSGSATATATAAAAAAMYVLQYVMFDVFPLLYKGMKI